MLLFLGDLMWVTRLHGGTVYPARAIPRMFGVMQFRPQISPGAIGVTAGTTWDHGEPQTVFLCHAKEKRER